MRNFSHTFTSNSIFTLDLGNDLVDSRSRIDYGIGLSRVDQASLREATRLKMYDENRRQAVFLLYTAFGNDRSLLKERSSQGKPWPELTPSEDAVCTKMFEFLHLCLSKASGRGTHTEIFSYVNCNTGASLLIVPVCHVDYEGYSLSFEKGLT